MRPSANQKNHRSLAKENGDEQESSEKGHIYYHHHRISNLIIMVVLHVWDCLGHLGMDQYLYIPFFSGMNIHLPAILMLTRCQGFDPSPFVGLVIHAGEIG